MIPIYKPYLPPKSLIYAHEAIDSGWISSLGKYKNLCEEKLKEILNVKYVLLVNSGTAATHLVSKSLKHKYPNIKKIIAQDSVYVAAWNSFLYDGDFSLEIRDVDEETWNLDKRLIKNIDEDTAVLIVHNLGNIFNVPKFKREHPGVIVVEDACESFFGEYEGKSAGTQSLCSSLSFFANKNITCLPKGTLVATEGIKKGNGSRRVKPIEEIEIGDMVWSRNENGIKELDKVVRTTVSETEELYKLNFSNGNEISLTGNHEVYVHNKGWIRTDNICEGDIVVQLLYHGLSGRLNGFKQKGKKYEDFMDEEAARERKLDHSHSIKKCHEDPSSGFNQEGFLYVQKQIEKAKRLDEFKSPEKVKERRELWKKRESLAFIEKWKDPVYRNKVVTKVNEVRSTPEYIKKYCQGLNMKPNKPELFILNLLDELGLKEYKFNGDGSVGLSINGSPPDFVNDIQRKLIYFNGCAWHCCVECNQLVNPRGIDYKTINEKDRRIMDECKNRGYQVLVLWEHELKDKELMREKILNFHYNPEAITVQVISIEKIQLDSKIKVYNIETEKNHNYFAYGILVHNCGEGGALITNDEDVYEYANLIHGQGQSKERYIHSQMGYNYRMTNIQAALLYGQLQIVNEIKERKNEIIEYYMCGLEERNEIQFQYEEDHTTHSNWMFGIRIRGNSGYKELNEFFLERGIETRPFFYPINEHGYLDIVEYNHNLDLSRILSRECVLLPSYPELTEKEIDYICDVVKKWVNQLLRS